MTQAECLKKTGEAFGVIEADGTINWYPDWFSAESTRYNPTKTPAEIAEAKQKKLDALAKGRQIKAQKKAGIQNKKTTPCPGGCGYMIAMCACPPLAEVNAKMLEGAASA